MPKTDYIFQSGDLFLSKYMRSFLETFIYGNYKQSIYITYWSIMHLLSGIVVAYVFKYYEITEPYFKGFIIHSLWELWQIFIGMSYPYKFTGKNNIFDILLDTVFFMFGMWLIYDSAIYSS